MHKSVAGLAVVLALALLAAPVSAESGVVTLSAGEETTVATYSLGAGDVVKWTYSSGGSVEFSIEHGVTEVYSTTTMVGTGDFRALEAGQYTFSFKNTGASLTIVSYDLQRPFDATPILLVGGIAAIALVGIIAAALVARKRKQAAGGPAPMPLAQSPPPPPPPPR